MWYTYEEVVLKAAADLLESVEVDAASTSDDGESYMTLGNVSTYALRILGLMPNAKGHKVETKEEPPEEEPVRCCIAYQCQNVSDQGHFVGDLCSPCYEYVINPQGMYGRHSQMSRNARSHVIALINKD